MVGKNITTRQLENTLKQAEESEKLGYGSTIPKRLLWARERYGYEIPAYLFVTYQNIIETYGYLANFRPIIMSDSELEERIVLTKRKKKYQFSFPDEYTPEYKEIIQEIFRAYLYGRTRISERIAYRYEKIIRGCLQSSEFQPFLDEFLP